MEVSGSSPLPPTPDRRKIDYHESTKYRKHEAKNSNHEFLELYELLKSKKNNVILNEVKNLMRPFMEPVLER
ncbi:TPA: hypothetical protein DEW49_04815 [bacterium]|nr:hypothetical protein [bacterium]